MSQTTQKLSTEETGIQQEDRRRWLMLAVLLLATFMCFLDLFIVNVAVPSIEGALHATFAASQLVIADYILGYAVLLATGGRLGDLYGRKKLFLLGVTGFTLCSALCSVAPTAFLLIIFRLLQGAFAALITPQVIATLQVSFNAAERATAFSAYSVAIGLASILGQPIGGLLLAANILNLSWRMIFLVNIPIGIIVVLAVSFLVRESRLQAASRLDPGGVVSLFGALTLFIYPLIEGKNAGWPLWTFLCMGLAIVLLVIFIRYEHRLEQSKRSPLIPLEIFRSRAFVVGTVSVMLNSMLFAAVMLVLAFYLQDGLHYSPLHASIVMMVMGTGFLLASSATPTLVRWFGKRTLGLGTILMTIGYALMVVATYLFAPAYVIIPLLIAALLAGYGNGMVFPQLMSKTLYGLNEQMIGTASGVYSTLQEVANALGVTVIGVIFAAALAHGDYTHAFGISLLVISLVSVGQFFLVFSFPKQS